MLKRILIFLSISFFCFLSSCNQNGSWHQAMTTKLQKYSRYSYSKLFFYFQRVGLHYPPKQLAFLVFKDTKQFEVYAKEDGDWKYIRTYPILKASGGLGPKMRSGDRQVPEGIYRIIGLNPRSRYNLSMHIDYPNDFDRLEASAERRRNLGGDIFIHGDKLSVGCIALGNETIQQLFPLVYYVGINNVRVIIAPEDFRVKPVFYNRLKIHPAWVKILYGHISQELKQFPEPSPLACLL